MDNEVWERGSVSIAVRLGPRVGSEVQVKNFLNWSGIPPPPVGGLPSYSFEG